MHSLIEFFMGFQNIKKIIAIRQIELELYVGY